MKTDWKCIQEKIKNNKRVMNVSLHPFDLTNQEITIKKMIQAGITTFHIDIMDGVFVKNFALCQKNILDIKNKFPDVVCEAHLMVKEPQNFIEEFAASKTDIFTFHYESLGSNEKVLNLINEVKKSGMKAGLMINLDTDISTIEELLKDLDLLGMMSIKTGFPGQDMNEAIINKIKQAKNFKEKNNFNYLIEVDGGVRENTYESICSAGAEILVVGHFLFDKNYNEQRRKIEE